MKKSMFIRYDSKKEYLHCAEKIKKAGFSHTFLWWEREDENRFQQINICEKLGLTIETAHTSFQNINSMWLDGDDGDTLTNYFIQSVREAKDCGIPILILHLSSSFTPPPLTVIGLSRYQRICDEAEKNGILIAFENLRRVDYLDYIMENLHSPAKRFCFDIGHENLYNQSTGVLEKYAPLLTALHLHDNLGKEDNHFLPFDGTIDWSNFTKRYVSIGKELPITIEVMKKDAEPDFAEKAYQRACRIEELICLAENNITGVPQLSY